MSKEPEALTEKEKAKLAVTGLRSREDLRNGREEAPVRLPTIAEIVEAANYHTLQAEVEAKHKRIRMSSHMQLEAAKQFIKQDMDRARRILDIKVKEHAIERIMEQVMEEVVPEAPASIDSMVEKDPELMSVLFYFDEVVQSLIIRVAREQLGSGQVQPKWWDVRRFFNVRRWT